MLFAAPKVERAKPLRKVKESEIQSNRTKSRGTRAALGFFDGRTQGSEVPTGS